jgi:hypothetical protein
VVLEPAHPPTQRRPAGLDQLALEGAASMNRDLDWWRAVRIQLHEEAEIESMTFPVRCAHCRRIYDLGAVEVTARYLDCSVWKAPCCGRTVDDRGPGWGRKDYEELDR